MREHPRRRPLLESLESKALLSGVSATAPIVALVATPTPPIHKVTIGGTAQGTYTVQKNSAAGEVLTFFGSGNLTLGLTSASAVVHADVTGTINSPGPTANGQSTGQIFIATAQGTLTLSVVGPPQNGSTPVPDTFTYQITHASGIYAGDTGQGYIVLHLTPTPSPTAVSGGGTFTMTFLTVAPPTPPTPVPV